MRDHDATKVVDTTAFVLAGTELIHEEMIESPLRPLHTNLISLWSSQSDSGMLKPILNVLSGPELSMGQIFVEIWSVPYSSHKEEDTKEKATYSKPLSEALEEVIATRRARSYVRIVSRNRLLPSRVRVNLTIAVDSRRLKSSWDHVRNPSILRGEDSLKPGEIRLVPRL